MAACEPMTPVVQAEAEDESTARILLSNAAALDTIRWRGCNADGPQEP